VTRRHPRSGLAIAFLAAALLALAVPWVGRAEDVLRLEGPVTDTAGALEGRTSEVEDAIDRTLDEHGVQVFVLFVRTTGDLPMADYAQQTAAANSLGVDDALLVVAMEDRTDYVWVSDGLDEITDDELDTVLTEELEPRLRDGDPAGAAIATVEALGVAADSPAPTDGPLVPGPVEPGPEPPPGGTTDGGGGIIGPLIAIILLAGGGFLLYRWWRSRRVAPTAPGLPPQPTPAQLSGPELRQRANALLIATDERIRDARQEVDFAEAQYGPDAVVELRQAVAGAADELAASFSLRQRLDDDEPEDDAAREAMQREIVERTMRAQATLDAETERIRQLRDLERDAPTTLVELPSRIEAVEDRLPTARATLEGLTVYAPTAWQPVAGHIEEAEKGLAGARHAVTLGSAAMARNDRPEVALATREALEGVTGAAELLDAIEALRTTIADAEKRLPAELAEADRDLRDTRTALAELGQLDPGVAGRVREAERAIDQAHEAARQRPADPVDALRLATEAYELAASDFSDWDQGGPGWGQRGGTSDGDATAQILGQILGGVIGGVIRSGGGGGWGGSPWGGRSRGGGGFPDLGGGLGGGWGRGGGFGTGGFGGGGGGGGRGRGGRW
jgi:uncharacterized membrane protein YgcG